MRRNPAIIGKGLKALAVFGPLVAAFLMVLPAAQLGRFVEQASKLTPRLPAEAARMTCEKPLDGETTRSGRFRVVGNAIIGPDGARFIAKGVNVNGYQWVWPRSTIKDVDLISTCWSFNLVRLNNYLFKGQTKWTQYDTNNDIAGIVQAFTERKIVVLIEAHDRIGAYYTGRDLDALVDWYTDLATRFRDNPYVWFDVMNEPGSGDNLEGRRWLSSHRRVISAIRNTAHADNVIVVEGASEARGLADGNAAEQGAILRLSRELLGPECHSVSNIVFSTHIYDDWNGRSRELQSYLGELDARRIPLLIGEYGAENDQDGKLVSTRDATTSMFRFVVPQKIGRVVWHWNGDDGNNLLTKRTPHGGGWQIDDCMAPTNLTWLGKRVWQDNHAGVN